MKKQISIIITIFIIGILIGCGMMYTILNPSIKVCPEIKKCPDCPKQETEKKEDNCIKEEIEILEPSPEKVLAIDEFFDEISLKPENKEDMYNIIGLSNSNYGVSDDLLGIMYSEREIDDLITLYVIDELFSIAYENNGKDIHEYQNDRLSIKIETIEKLGKEIYKDYQVPRIINGSYQNIYEAFCKENTCEFYWEIWGYVGPGESHYRSNTISEKKSGKNTIITVEILYEEIEVIDSEEEVLESSTIRKRHDSVEKKNIGVQYKNHNFDYYQKHLSSTEKYQYTFDQNNTLISIKRVN